jgi:hypothetical protein
MCVDMAPTPRHVGRRFLELDACCFELCIKSIDISYTKVELNALGMLWRVTWEKDETRA